MILNKLRRLLGPRDPERFHFVAGTVRGSISPKEFAAALAAAGTTPGELEALMDCFSVALREAGANRTRLEIMRREVPLVESTAERLVPLARAVFDLQPIDPKTGRGATGQEAIGVLFEYSTWATHRRIEELDRRERVGE